MIGLAFKKNFDIRIVADINMLDEMLGDMLT